MVCTFIGIENLAANAMIELMERNHTKEISFETLVHYGLEVARIFQEKTGEEAILLISRAYQVDMIENYSDFFDVHDETFYLKDSVNLEELKTYFRWTMSTKLLHAFMDPEAIRKLGVVV